MKLRLMWIWLRDAATSPETWIGHNSAVANTFRLHDGRIQSLEKDLATTHSLILALTSEVNALRETLSERPQNPSPAPPRRVPWKEFKNIAAHNAAKEFEGASR